LLVCTLCRFTLQEKERQFKQVKMYQGNR